MATTLRAEASVLERIMHLLEEGSVTHLAQQDDHFASFVEQLYSTVYERSETLQQIETNKRIP